MQATAEMAMGGGFRRNSVSELKLKNRCTGSTLRGIVTRRRGSSHAHNFHVKQ